MPVLRYAGETSDQLPAVKERLAALGYLEEAEGEYSVTYDSATRTAVKLFQKYHGLTADSRAGRETLAFLYSPEAMDEKTARAGGGLKSTSAPTPGGQTEPTVAP